MSLGTSSWGQSLTESQAPSWLEHVPFCPPSCPGTAGLEGRGCAWSPRQPWAPQGTGEVKIAGCSFGICLPLAHRAPVWMGAAVCSQCVLSSSCQPGMQPDRLVKFYL